MSNYINTFKYIGAYDKFGSRRKNEVWIDYTATPNECVKLRERFGLVAGFFQSSGPWVIQFQAIGRHPFRRQIRQDPNWIKLYNQIIYFKWYASQHLSGSENSKWTITLEFQRWCSQTGYQTYKQICIPHHKGTFSNKELVKLVLNHII